jgi:hypothetical protein
MKPPEFVRRWHVYGLIRVACYLGVVSMGLMCWSVLRPAALPVVIGMSVGQGLGVLAFLCYLLAVINDISRAPPASTREPPSTRDTPT